LENYQPEACIRKNDIKTSSRSLVCQWSCISHILYGNRTEGRGFSIFHHHLLSFHRERSPYPFSPLLPSRSAVATTSGRAVWCAMATTSSLGPSPPGTDGSSFPRLPLGALAPHTRQVNLHHRSCARHWRRQGQCPPGSVRSVTKARHGHSRLVGHPHGAALAPPKEGVLRRRHHRGEEPYGRRTSMLKFRTSMLKFMEPLPFLYSIQIAF
jgi:hypothetical protein